MTGWEATPCVDCYFDAPNHAEECPNWAPGRETSPTLDAYQRGRRDALDEVIRQLSLWQSDPGINTAIVVVKRMTAPARETTRDTP